MSVLNLGRTTRTNNRNSQLKTKSISGIFDEDQVRKKIGSISPISKNNHDKKIKLESEKFEEPHKEVTLQTPYHKILKKKFLENNNPIINCSQRDSKIKVLKNLNINSDLKPYHFKNEKAYNLSTKNIHSKKNDIFSMGRDELGKIEGYNSSRGNKSNNINFKKKLDVLKINPKKLKRNKILKEIGIFKARLNNIMKNNQTLNRTQLYKIKKPILYENSNYFNNN